MLGLRQSLVTSGKIGILNGGGGGEVINAIDIGTIGSIQDGGTALLRDVSNSSNATIPANKSIAYTVIPQLVAYYKDPGISTASTYVATWEEARDYAYSIVLSSQKGEEPAKFIGANQYNANPSPAYNVISNPDPRFSIYPNIEYVPWSWNMIAGTVNFIVVDYEVIDGEAVIVSPNAISNPATYLIKEWWDKYFVLENQNIEYTGSKYIWGPRAELVGVNANFAYALNVYTGEEELRPVTEKNSFLLFRTFLYDSFETTDAPLEEFESILPAAPAPTGYEFRPGLGALSVPPTITQTYSNKIYIPSGNLSKILDFEIEFDATRTGTNANADLFIQPPFKDLKKITFPDNSTRIDYTQDPGLQITVDLLYFYETYGGVRISHAARNIQGQVVQFGTAGAEPQFPKIVVTSIPVQKITYTYTYRLNLSTLAGFGNEEPANIIGPIAIYNLRFKVPNKKESSPVNFGKYAIKNIPNLPSFSFPIGSQAQNNTYVINKTNEEFYAATQANPILQQKFAGILTGTQL